MYIQTFTKIVPIKHRVIHDRLKYPQTITNSRLSAFIYLFIETSFAWVTKLSVNTFFQFGPGVKHNTSKIV